MIFNKLYLTNPSPGFLLYVILKEIKYYVIIVSENICMKCPSFSSFLVTLPDYVYQVVNYAYKEDSKITTMPQFIYIYICLTNYLNMYTILLFQWLTIKSNRMYNGITAGALCTQS